MQFHHSLELFHHLLSLDENKMHENLLKYTEKDKPLYGEVVALIQAHERNKKHTSFNLMIEQSSASLTNDDSIKDLEGMQIGRYQLVRKLGQGGMGVVYLGQRNDGELEQKVAFKFVFPSISQIAGEAFLNNEAQHLVNLVHPNIATVHTLDKTENSLSYMLMEFVDGTPIDQYCQQQKLNETQRLQLLIKVCKAIQYSHQNMVVHADIKPSNILVTKDGEPKIMDFGIARSTQQDATSSPENKNTKVINAASSKFASPEQLQGKPLNATADIYSLGKLLKALGCVTGELNYIVNKCCQKEPDNRYQLVFELLQDIENWIHNYPLASKKASTTLSFIKAVQRNPVVSSLALVLMLSSVLFTHNLYMKNKEIQTALDEQTAVTAFMISIFSQANSHKREKVGDYSIENLLEDMANKAFVELDDYPSSKTRVLYELALSYQAGKKFVEAERLLEKMAPLYGSQEENIEYEVNYYVTRAYVYHKLGKIEKAKQMYELVDTSVQKLNLDRYSAKRALITAHLAKAYFLDKLGQSTQAKDLLLALVSEYEPFINPTKKVSLYNSLGVLLFREGDVEQAAHYLELSIQSATEKYSNPAHPSVLQMRKNLLDLNLKSNYTESIKVEFNKLKQDVINVYKDGSELESSIDLALAIAYGIEKKFSKAFAYNTDAVEGFTLLGNKKKLIIALYGKAETEASLNQFSEAKNTVTKAESIAEKQYGQTHIIYLSCLFRSYKFNRDFLKQNDVDMLTNIYQKFLKHFPDHQRTQAVKNELDIQLQQRPLQ